MKTVKNILRAISLALALFASSAPASERIMSMDVTGIVSADAHLTVTEKLRVRVENVDIRHGIIRDFPTEYTGSDGASYSTDFEFVSAEIDGRPASVSVSRRGGTAEMRIGDPNAYLRRGEREISVTYRTLGWIAFRESFDELYWNVTGNEWEFPIDRASFKLALPPGGVISQIAAYTGKTGRQGADWKSTKDGVISTTRALAPGEGLTVVYAWNKGVVTPPRVSWYRRLGEPFFAAGIAAAVFLYYFAAWYMVGRDPAARRIIPLYRPPKGVEPGFARYLKDLRFSDDCIAADIIQLATLGFVRFSGGEDARNLTIEATDDASDNEALAALPDSLASVMSSIFPAGRRREIEVDSAGGSVFNDAAERLKRVYGARAREYFRKNTVFSAMGMIFFLPFFLVVPSALIRMIFFLPMGSNLGVWTIAILAAMTKRSKQFIKIIVKVLGLLLAVLFIAG
ncbi:MAG: DUF2207 domain-containing protein, partial [Synergistaceae bacterium]|nr:DUF2207 domain-containing protein [Synergistaceae bacterium]